MNEYLLIFASFILGAIFGVFVRWFAKFLALLFLAGIFFLLLLSLLKEQIITVSQASLTLLATSLFSLSLLFLNRKAKSGNKHVRKA